MDSPSTANITHTVRHSPPGPSLAPTSRLALECSALTSSHLSSRVIATIQASRRPATTRIYEATWKALASWCLHRSHDALALTLPTLLEFLQDGLDKGLRPNTLRRQVAAISTVIDCGTGMSLARHPTIQRFLRGATNLRPPVIHRFPTWELTTVLEGLTTSPFEPLRSASLKRLSWKTSFLIAITSARRISELAALSVKQDLCVFHSDRVVLRLDPSFIPKVNSVFHRAQEIVLPDFCPSSAPQADRRWHKLDVRRTLQIYLDRTRQFRKTEALFVSIQDQTLGQKVSSLVIGRWIRACIASAYSDKDLTVPEGITAHSTRSAAASAAWSTQASVEEVCRAATWASPSPFIKHYRIDAYASADAAFGRRVLQRVQASSPSQDQSIALPEHN